MTKEFNFDMPCGVAPKIKLCKIKVLDMPNKVVISSFFSRAFPTMQLMFYNSDYTKGVCPLRGMNPLNKFHDSF